MAPGNHHQRRRSGILLPISALPSSHGVGDFGPAAYQFIDWLQRAGQRAWQILPLSIPDHTGSPYASLSTAAGNWLFINPERLMDQGLLPPNWHPAVVRRSSVNYPKVFQLKWRMIRSSFAHFTLHGTSAQRRRFATFRHKAAYWLDDYVLFQAIKDRHDQQPWWKWEPTYRTLTTARRHHDQHLTKQMTLHAYAQWLWSEQWAALRRYANQHSVKIIGDMPFFIRTDSVNVWANPKLFLVSRNGHQTVVAGVPPDDFSRDGQKWGNPLYRWPAHQRQKFRWWIERFRLLHDRVDIVRFDHFRGLVHTWHVPASADSARRGHWVPSPGRALLRAVKRHVPRLNFIAEDLGPEGVGADGIRRAFHAPTIRLLVFGWNGLPNNPHALSAITPDVVYYTTNHDTDTFLGWWRHQAKWYERKHFRETVGRVTDPAWQSVTAAAGTAANLVVVPIQDVLGLGSAARLNRPGRQRGNWSWRLSADAFSLSLAKRLYRLAKNSGRT